MTVKYVKKYTVPSDSVAGKEYLVSITEHGQYQCSCKHWTTRHVECKHILRVKENPEAFETSLGTTTIGLELNPSRRDNKRTLTFMTENEKELRIETRKYINSNGFWDDDMPTFKKLSEIIWDYMDTHPIHLRYDIDFDRFEQIFSESDFEPYDIAWLKNFACRIENEKMPYYQPILNEIKLICIILDEEEKQNVPIL
jgi:hypothetical protein